MERLALFVGVGLLAGCDEPRTGTVEGLVTLGGKPLADAEVQFIPDPTQGSTGPPASAYTDQDGRYRIAAGQGGAVVGTHRVCVNDATVMMPGGGADVNDGQPNAVGGRAARSRSRVPAVYSDAARTPFSSIEVRPGSQTVDFPLKFTP